MIEIIPAINIRDGKCVQLRQGDYSHAAVCGDDPVAIARRWSDEGAPRLHVVDLDGAQGGLPSNLDLIASIVAAVAVPIQMGGGVRSTSAVRAVLEAGVARCIIGSQALQKPEWALQVFAEFGTSVALGLDAMGEFVATTARQETGGVSAIHFAQAMQAAGCARMIYTDSARHGTMGGPDAGALRAFAEALEIPVIPGGGVHKATDIRILRVIPRVEGIIVGAALYAGTVSLQHLLQVAAEPVGAEPVGAEPIGAEPIGTVYAS